MHAIKEEFSTTDFPEATKATWTPWLDAAELRRMETHPLLRALASGNVGIDPLRSVLIQHQHYSRNFTRYLCALISQLDDIDDIRGLTGNLLEEMGVDDNDKITHTELYQHCMRAVGAVSAEQPPLPQTQTMIRTMLGHCRSPDPVHGLAALCLGAEAIVPIIYRPFLLALQALGFQGKATEFFEVHIEEDEDHALTMLAMLEKMTTGNPSARANAIAIGAQMIRCRIDMFDALWQQLQQAPMPGEDAATAFSSKDFWRVPATLQARIPERLHHPAVQSAQAAQASRFSAERAHAVHIVDLPSHAISMTIGRLAPGQATRMHRHNYETVIYVVSGSGRSHIGPRTIEWKAGDAFYVPVWAAHRHIGADADAGECVYVACENAPQLQNMGGIALREELDADRP